MAETGTQYEIRIGSPEDSPGTRTVGIQPPLSKEDRDHLQEQIPLVIDSGSQPITNYIRFGVIKAADYSEATIFTPANSFGDKTIKRLADTIGSLLSNLGHEIIIDETIRTTSKSKGNWWLFPAEADIEAPIQPPIERKQPAEDWWKPITRQPQPAAIAEQTLVSESTSVVALPVQPDLHRPIPV